MFIFRGTWWYPEMLFILSHEPPSEVGFFWPSAHGSVVVTAAGFTAAAAAALTAAAARRIFQQPLPLIPPQLQSSGHASRSVLPLTARCWLGNLPLFVIISPCKDAVGFPTSRFLLQPIPVSEVASSPRSVFDGFFLQYCHVRLCLDSANSNVGKHQIAKERAIEVFASIWINLYAVCLLDLERRVTQGPIGFPACVHAPDDELSMSHGLGPFLHLPLLQPHTLQSNQLRTRWFGFSLFANMYRASLVRGRIFGPPHPCRAFLRRNRFWWNICILWKLPL